MVDVTITDPLIGEVTEPANADFFLIETAAGTRRVQRVNSLPRKAEIAALVASQINLTNDVVYFGDGTDGLFKSITVFDLIFGNFRNGDRTDDFTLSPDQDGARPIECRDTFTTNTITLDGNVADIGGCNFLINNYTPNNLILVPANIVLFQDGATVASATIRRDTSASVNVRNDTSEAIFSGG